MQAVEDEIEVASRHERAQCIEVEAALDAAQPVVGGIDDLHLEHGVQRRILEAVDADGVDVDVRQRRRNGKLRHLLRLAEDGSREPIWRGSTVADVEPGAKCNGKSLCGGAQHCNAAHAAHLMPKSPLGPPGL